MRVRTTRYGKSPAAGGWDKDGDSSTDAGYGAFDAEGHPTLQEGDCALAISVVNTLGVKPRQLLQVTWPNGRVGVYRFTDKAPEVSDPNSRFYAVDPDRFDIYLPLEDDPSIPDWGDAVVLPVERAIPVEGPRSE